MLIGCLLGSRIGQSPYDAGREPDCVENISIKVDNKGCEDGMQRDW
jgi:hypothetical protein